MNPRPKSFLKNVYKFSLFKSLRLTSIKQTKSHQSDSLRFKKVAGTHFFYPNDLTPAFAYWESAKRMNPRLKPKKVDNKVILHLLFSESLVPIPQAGRTREIPELTLAFFIPLPVEACHPPKTYFYEICSAILFIATKMI